MRVSVCHDVEYIKSVLIDDPEMFDRAADDYTDASIESNFGSALWLECYRDDKRIGLSAIKIASSSVLNIHIHIQKQNRGRGMIELGKIILKWVVDNSAPRFYKINTKIPVIYRDVIRFAHKLGFNDEGIDRLSIMKNGKLIDRQNLGITFEEVRLELS